MGSVAVFVFAFVNGFAGETGGGLPALPDMAVYSFGFRPHTLFCLKIKYSSRVSAFAPIPSGTHRP